MRRDGWRAIEKQAGAGLGKRTGAHRWFVSALKVLPVGGLARDAEKGKRGQLGLTHAELIQCRPKGRGEGLREVGLAALEAVVDGKPLDRQPAIPGCVLLVVLEIRLQPGPEPLPGIGRVAGGPVDPAAEERRHLILEGGKDRLLILEVEIKRPLGETGRLYDRTNGRAVVAVTLEDPAGGVQQLAAAHPLPFRQGRLAGRFATD